ncbi:MAG: hypothetical protein IPJ20_14350 [Flammeovirgaceae bacterium]|nr:hypothetical protein [Flammeovirgaceae bacterium]
MTITKATVTATAESKTRVYNSANPTFTIVYAGFVNGDNSTVLHAMVASSWPFEQSGGELSNRGCGGNDIIMHSLSQWPN